MTIKTYPNLKLWIDGGIHAKLKARTTAFTNGKMTGNMAGYKQSSYSLRKAIKLAKCRYRDKVESQFNGSDTRRMWQCLQTITDFKREKQSCPDKLNTFFARFEDNTVPPTIPLAASSEHAQTCWLVCLRTYSISPYPSLLSPFASRCPPLFLYPRKQR